MTNKQITLRGNNAGWGSNFIRVLDKAIWAERNSASLYVYFGPETKCYYDNKINNLWELCFDSFEFLGKSQQIPYPDIAFIESNFGDPRCLSSANRNLGEDTYKKYVESKIKPHIKEKVSLLMTEIGLVEGQYDSLHFRGTDWAVAQQDRSKLTQNLRSLLFPLSKYVQEVSKYYDPTKKLFVMSDNEETISCLKDNFNNIVYLKDIVRAKTYVGPSVHSSWNSNNPPNSKLIEDITFETLIASKASSFIHSEGNIDLMVLVMNASLTSKYIKTLR